MSSNKGRDGEQRIRPGQRGNQRVTRENYGENEVHIYIYIYINTYYFKLSYAASQKDRRLPEFYGIIISMIDTFGFIQALDGEENVYFGLKDGIL